MNTYEFLANTYWYVPVPFLPALQINPEDNADTILTDQTVWQITDYRSGYFWGNCAVLLYPEGTTPTDAPRGMRMAGSVTPHGRVLISFMPVSNAGAALSTSGWGELYNDNGWKFEMQMASGTTSLVAHWAWMMPVQPGDPAWNNLPGANMSVPDFMAAAGFQQLSQK